MTEAVMSRMSAASGTRRLHGTLDQASPAPRPLRVLHCPNVIGGHPPGLARAERGLGLASRAVSFYTSPFNFACDEQLFAARDGLLRRELKRWKFLLRSLSQFDIFHFNFGSSTMPRGFRSRSQTKSLLGRLGQWYARTIELVDLPLLKRAGKGIVVTFQGDDIRQGDYCREHFPIHFANEVHADYYPPEVDPLKRRWIETFDRYADRIYTVALDLGHVLPPRAQFLPYCHVDFRDWQPVYPTTPAGGKLTVMHAPTDRAVKGTRFVLEAVERLRSVDRIDFNFVLIENMTHEAAKQAYRRADLLIDQLLVGSHGGLAVELMALGKPVVCYLRPEDKRFMPPAMNAQMPIIEAEPNTIYAVLREWLTTRRGELAELGRRSRAFVEAWYDPVAIASQLKADYEAIWVAKQRR